MEAQGDPFRRGLPTLQTSLTLPELPCTATAVSICKISLVFWNGGCRTGKFLVDWEARTSEKVRLRACLVDGARLEVMPYTSAEIPPAGAPSGFDSAAIIGFSIRRCTVVPLRSE